MNKNLIEIWNQSKSTPRASDNFVIIGFGYMIYFAYMQSNFYLMFAFGLLFVFKMFNYIKFLITPQMKLDEEDTIRAKKIYELLDNGK